MEMGAGFRVTGAVIRKFVAPSRKVAFLTLGVPGQKGENKIDLRSFEAVQIDEVDSVGVGQIVQVTGRIDTEPVKDKKGEKVLVDGYAKWVPALTIREIKVEGSSAKPKPPEPKASQAGWDDKDDLLF